MNVNETIDLGDGHSIEIGPASWDNTQTSVKNRYAKNANGKVCPAVIGEIPLTDIGSIVSAVAERDLFDVDVAARLIEVLTGVLARRAGSTSHPTLNSLLEKVTDENRHPEFETGPAVGNETW